MKGVIGDFFDVKGGKRLPKGQSFESMPTKYPYLRVVDFKRNSLDQSGIRYISDEVFKKIRKYTISSEDVYISIAGTIGVAGIIPHELNGANLTENAAKISPKEGIKVNQKYLSYFLNSSHIQSVIKSKTMAVGVPKLALFRIKEIPVSLPPLETQKKIASILDAADAYRQKTKALIQKYDELTQSLFLEMFGDPVTNSKGWPIHQINKVCSKVTDGTHDTPSRIDHGERFITGKHIRPYKIDFDSSDFVALEVHREIFRRCNPEYGDVLYTNIGANVGTAAFNNVRYEFSMKNVALFKPLKTDLNGRFLEYFLNSENMKEEVIRIASLGGAQKFLSLKDLRKLKVALPPIEIQNDFEVRIEKIEKQKVQAQESLEKAEELFSSLLQRAFKGELV